MSNTRAGNVIRVDTSAALTDVRNVRTVKYLGASSGTASIKKTDTNGAILWSASGSSDQVDQDLYIRCNTGIYVTVASSAVVLLYLE
jgi:hypothetical protein